MKNNLKILGAGITGLSAGLGSGADIFEGSSSSGGLCASYYMDLNGRKSPGRDNDESYRFEIGGGHWIFGSDREVLKLIQSLTKVKSYSRKSSVYLPDIGVYVPYPIQNHLSFLPADIRQKALDEILKSSDSHPVTMAEWLEASFGKTLCELFFFPFHEAYTAGLYKKIAPQDSFKTPIDKELILKGSKDKTPSVGYNARFVYPEDGLDDLIGKLSDKCRIEFNKRVVKVDLTAKKITFSDGNVTSYENLVSTVPLNRMVEMAGVNAGAADPYTSVLVINIGARKGAKCPEDHWIYVPRSKAGFHRVGFYSNVDASFLPRSSRDSADRVSIYVEKTYKGSERPDEKQIKQVCDDVVKELKAWQFISEVEVIDPTWIDIAYTWRYPGSKWREDAIRLLGERGIHQTGRYGKWAFQGIAESIRDGMSIASEMRKGSSM